MTLAGLSISAMRELVLSEWPKEGVTGGSNNG